MYHHYARSVAKGSARALGLPKALRVGDGAVVLTPWSGLEAIRRDEVATADLRWRPVVQSLWKPGSWVVRGRLVEGRCADAVAGCLADAGSADEDVTCSVLLHAGARCGIMVGCDDAMRSGVALIIDCVHDGVAMGSVATVVEASHASFEFHRVVTLEPMRRWRVYRVQCDYADA